MSTQPIVSPTPARTVRFSDRDFSAWSVSSSTGITPAREADAGAPGGFALHASGAAGSLNNLAFSPSIAIPDQGCRHVVRANVLATTGAVRLYVVNWSGFAALVGPLDFAQGASGVQAEATFFVAVPYIAILWQTAAVAPLDGRLREIVVERLP